MKFYRRFAQAAGFLLLLAFAVLPEICRAQSYDSRTASSTPQIHKDFPFQMMWDDALTRSQMSGKPVLAFDLDLIDSASVGIASEVLDNPQLASFISDRFEAALNDFAIDPPLSVGLDSLRILGQRLSGLEKRYRLGVRPTLLVIAPDGTEIDRIVNPNRFTADALRMRLTDILEGRNTIGGMIREFWADTNSIVARQRLIDKFEEHGLYDSVVYHLESLRHSANPMAARAANIRYAGLRLQVEGDTQPIRELIATLGATHEDSLLHQDALREMLSTFQKRKAIDSVLYVYNELLQYSGRRDPSLLNDYAWYISGYTKQDTTALALVDEALRSRPNDPDFLDTRALVLARMGRIDEAIANETRAYELAAEEDKPDFKESLDALKERKQALVKETKPKSKSKLKSKSK